MTTPEMPPLRHGPTTDASWDSPPTKHVTLASVEARERIPQARIAELEAEVADMSRRLTTESRRVLIQQRDDARDEADKLRNQLAAPQPQAEPVGEWVMVPREPTLAMLGAGRAKARDGYTLEAAWEAMLAAAPDRGGA